MADAEIAEPATTTDAAPRATANRSTTPTSSAFSAFIGSRWPHRDEPVPPARVAAPSAAAHRAAISRLHPGTRLIMPAGGLRQRSNDTDYPFRAHSAFAQLTGWGSDAEPGSVLVLEPTATGHDATLYFRERAGRDSDEFYANPEIGEFWIGPRPSLAQVAGDLALPTRPLDELQHVLAGVEEGTATLIVREADAALTARVDAGRAGTGRAGTGRAEGTATGHASGGIDAAAVRDAAAQDVVLARDLSELRLVKDAWEIDQLRGAISATHRGFDDIIRALPRAVRGDRGERVIEGAFDARARLEGNAVGYATIAAAGAHACILHWTRNDGAVRDGDLVLVDAGVEADSLFTADITRTLPVSGRFSDQQRLVYETVREAADAAFAIVRPGIRFREIHATAMRVIARRMAEWGILTVDAETALQADQQQHRRYMVHGTSHHLGLDVHDCAQARRAMYLDGVLEPGMTFTIEPGLYFQPDDLTVPERLRGIGVRIEDDILVTADGAENLSAAIPRTADEVEAWIAGLR
jgi:Xaa-Pro aminopeptidase